MKKFRIAYPELMGQSLADYLKKCSVAVIGLGQSGISAVKLLKKSGSLIFISESRKDKKTLQILKSLKVKYEAGSHTKKILNSDLIISSPGVHLDIPVLVQAKKMGIPIWNEFELGYRLTSIKKVAAVTGTNGKTTTVSLIGEIFFQNGWKTVVAGNIGRPLCDYAGSGSKYDVAVLEVSSYQLEGMNYFHPDVSAILNLTPDHLQRHKTMARYAKAKERIFKDQSAGDFAVLNASDPWCVKMSEHCKARVIWFSAFRHLKNGVFFDSQKNKIIARFSSEILKFSPPKNLAGLHNVENSCAAIACALKLGVKPSAIEDSMKTFHAVEHRLEKVKEISGVTYVNDSKATNVDSTLKAIDSFDQPLWLILGGEDKGAPYTPIKKMLEKRIFQSRGAVKGVFLIGESSDIIHKDLKGMCPFFFCKKMENAVKKSMELAEKGDVVLLAPACASFDQYENFEERGRHFKMLLRGSVAEKT